MISPSDSETDVPDLPGRSRAEIGAGLARAAISSVPLVGGAAAELFDLVLAPSLERRRDEWMGYLGEAVEELRERLDGFDPRDLEGNEQFVSSVLAASTLAMRTHQTEKLRMLRNAIVNSVLPGAPDDYEQMAFLRYVDELTPLHARALAFVADPRGWFERHGIEQPTFMAAGLSTILEIGLPEMKDRRAMYDPVIGDLDQRRLAGAASALHTTMTNEGVWAGRATERGTAFLRFVTLDGDLG